MLQFVAPVLSMVENAIKCGPLTEEGKGSEMAINHTYESVVPARYPDTRTITSCMEIRDVVIPAS